MEVNTLYNYCVYMALLKLTLCSIVPKYADKANFAGNSLNDLINKVLKELEQENAEFRCFH